MGAYNIIFVNILQYMLSCWKAADLLYVDAARRLKQQCGTEIVWCWCQGVEGKLFQVDWSAFVHAFYIFIEVLLVLLYFCCELAG